MRRRVALIVGVIALVIAGLCVLRSLRTRPNAQASLHSTSAHAASAPSTQEQLVDAELTASEPPASSDRSSVVADTLAAASPSPSGAKLNVLVRAKETGLPMEHVRVRLA